MAKKKAEMEEGQAPSHRGTAMKIDPRAIHLLNQLVLWVDDYQYRIVMKLVCREVRRQGMADNLPPHHRQELLDMEEELGLDPNERGKIRREPD